MIYNLIYKRFLFKVHKQMHMYWITTIKACMKEKYKEMEVIKRKFKLVVSNAILSISIIERIIYHLK
jgi:hypothetical protein